MTKHSLREAYRIGQENCGISVGDRVKVLREAEDREQGWGLLWFGCMNKYIGKVGTVVAVRSPVEGFKVDFDDPRETVFSYPYFILLTVSPQPSLEEAYLIAQENCGIEVGDTVRLLREARDNESGWDMYWVKDMNENLGHTGVVRDINQGGIRVEFPSERRGGCRYPWFVLELISKPPPKPQRPVFNVGSDNVLYSTPKLTKSIVKNFDALELSIEKWEAITDFLEFHPGESVDDGGATTCALCQMHGCGDCGDCPIEEFTGGGCSRSPYGLYEMTRSLTAAKAELWFLRALKEWMKG